MMGWDGDDVAFHSAVDECEARGKRIAELERENAELRESNKAVEDALEAHRAWKEEVEKQEPVAFSWLDNETDEAMVIGSKQYDPSVCPKAYALYARPAPIPEGWISIKDQPPTTDEPIVYARPDTSRGHGCWHVGIAYWTVSKTWNPQADSEHNPKGFTHWMPLPAAPQPKGKA